jgi:hypothetical protein
VTNSPHQISLDGSAAIVFTKSADGTALEMQVIAGHGCDEALIELVQTGANAMSTALNLLAARSQEVM